MSNLKTLSKELNSKTNQSSTKLTRDNLAETTKYSNPYLVPADVIWEEDKIRIDELLKDRKLFSDKSHDTLVAHKVHK